jgi:hypothetical protein
MWSVIDIFLILIYSPYKKGLLLAREVQVQRVVLETHNSRLWKLAREEQDRSFHGPRVDEIKHLLCCFSDTLFQAV